MRRNRIRLNENQLNTLIKKSILKVINESVDELSQDTYRNAYRKSFFGDDYFWKTKFGYKTTLENSIKIIDDFLNYYAESGSRDAHKCIELFKPIKEFLYRKKKQGDNFERKVNESIDELYKKTYKRAFNKPYKEAWKNDVLIIDKQVNFIAVILENYAKRGSRDAYKCIELFKSIKNFIDRKLKQMNNIYWWKVAPDPYKEEQRHAEDMVRRYGCMNR